MAKRPLLPIPIPDALNPFKAKKKRLMNFNPVDASATRPVVEQVKVTVFEYDAETVHEEVMDKLEDCFRFSHSNCVKWINVDGVRRKEVEAICREYNIHHLLMEDIISEGQRAKMDEMANNIFCLLPMTFFRSESSSVDMEQVSLVLTKNVVISFQDDPQRDVFDPIRERLRIKGTKLRNNGPDYLLYSLIDAIVDNYFIVMDKLGERIEVLEDIIPRQPNNRTLGRINYLRKEALLFKRGIVPVREVITGLLKTDNDFIQENTRQYLKDVYDHIIQATELAENYRDMVINLQELYSSQITQKMNEVMKVLAVVTTLLAPMTVITGIYGMNFDRMPELRNPNGYYIVLGVMLAIFVTMILIFRKRGWF